VKGLKSGLGERDC